MRTVLFGVALVVAHLVGCSSSEPEEGRFTDCALDDRIGTWRFTATEEVGGTCGPLASQLLIIDDPLVVLDGCTLDRADWLSSNECELRRSFTCEIPSTVETCARSESYIAITRQQSEDRVTGTVGLTITTSSDCEDAVACSSTYAVRYERE